MSIATGRILLKLKKVQVSNGTHVRAGQGTVLCPTLLASSSDENGNVTHNIAGDTITYVYDSEYNSTTGTYTDTV